MTQHQFFQNLNECQAWHRLRPKTQDIYTSWFRRYIHFLTESPEKKPAYYKIMDFLQEGYAHHSASSKRQAISALVWLYTHIFQQEVRPPKIRHARKLPDRLEKKFVALELSKLPHKYQFMGWIFYGSGLKYTEALSLRHRDIKKGYIYMADRDFYIPLCKQARHLYASWPEKIEENLIFCSPQHVSKPLSQTAFLMSCRTHQVDRRITPGTLRANFILLALERYGVPWTQRTTGLSSARITQFLRSMQKKIDKNIK